MSQSYWEVQSHPKVHEGDIELDANIIAQLPSGATIKSCRGHGGSNWNTTARIDFQVNGEQITYFLKLAEGPKAAAMFHGEYESMKLINEIVPAFSPKPLAWGKCKDSDRHFIPFSFHILHKGLPSIPRLTHAVAQLHTLSVDANPTGKFGFHTTTYNGTLPQDNTWTDTWEEFYIRGMRQIYAVFGIESLSSDSCSAAQEPVSSASRDMLNGQSLADRAAHALNQLIRMDIPRLRKLVQVWLDKKVNLPLAEPFVARCADATQAMTASLPSSTIGLPEPSAVVVQQAKLMLRNTRRRLVLRRESTVAEYFAQMFGDNLRWESLGIFFNAATRAALDVASFPSLYTDDQQRRDLIRALTYVGDCCLETCLALDSMNDLQLILQYENFIVHSQVDGDQSYHSWRRIGDVASSLFALGYHEKIDETTSNIPLFVAELRKATSARVYAADKSLAIFLGRPPRIVKAYCIFQLPANLPNIWDTGDATTAAGQDAERTVVGETSSNDLEVINYTADTRCSARFAWLKEDVLGLFRHRMSPDQVEKASAIRAAVEDQWRELPAHFKLTTSLRHCHSDPFTRDFLVGTRLDYLHTLFLLHLASLRQISEPDEALLTVAGEMLSHIVEVIILRDRLVNSWTSLIWKVAQYGLPAAGIISLALLHSTVNTGASPFSRSRLVQDLSVLVAEIRTGAMIQAGEPNFALFTRATSTIQSLLDSLMTWGQSRTDTLNSQVDTSTQYMDRWDPCINFDPWEFEIDFWANLAEHPTLHGTSHEN
ncbi:hypothetical protein AK830_g722 [Neonectria ditissima]|uniref:protein-ribulosamine 3-kinase n=1 Tax=Neonectria ditissima TaxID=78410 RepID=A0A0P7BVY9_9HYPO|nr:hypothetical protein AK830_g722 [Neonectria ditissima]